MPEQSPSSQFTTSTVLQGICAKTKLWEKETNSPGPSPSSAVPQRQNQFLLQSSPGSTTSQQRLCFHVKVNRFPKFNQWGQDKQAEIISLALRQLKLIFAWQELDKSMCQSFPRDFSIKATEGVFKKNHPNHHSTADIVILVADPVKRSL